MALLDELMQYAIGVEFDDYPLIGQTASRNQSVTTVQASPRFWKFVVDLQTPILRWDEYRGMVQRIRSTAMFEPFTFNFTSTPNLWTLVEYQGSLTTVELAALQVTANQSAGTTYLYLSGAPVSKLNVFKAGDYIQTGNAVRTVRTDTNSDINGNVVVYLSDPLVVYPTVGSSIITGKDVSWNNCYFNDLPTPGISYEYMDGITWTGKFSLVQTLS